MDLHPLDDPREKSLRDAVCRARADPGKGSEHARCCEALASDVRRAFTLALGLALTALPPSAPASTSNCSVARVSARQSITVGALLSGASFGLRSLTVERARTLGKVVREVVEKLPRDWNDGDGELHTVVLDGLELEFAVPRGRTSFLTSATISKPSWSLPGGIGVGVPFERVRRALGEGQREGNVVRYVGGDAPEAAEFTLEHDTVVRVKLIPYTG